MPGIASARAITSIAITAAPALAPPLPHVDDQSTRAQVLAEMRAGLVAACADLVRALAAQEALSEAPSPQDTDTCAVIADHIEAASRQVNIAEMSYATLLAAGTAGAQPLGGGAGR